MHQYGSDIELINALKQKEPLAYSAVFNLYARPLIYFIERLTRNTQVSQDLATESFLKTFGRSEQFEELVKFKSFLFTVANNAALDWLKAEKRRNARMEGYVVEESTNQVEKRVIDAEVIQAVFQEIEQLPPQVREVVKMTVIDGKSIDDIAGQMGIAYKTVQNHKTRGFNILRTKLVKDQLLSTSLLFILFKLDGDGAFCLCEFT